MPRVPLPEERGWVYYRIFTSQGTDPLSPATPRFLFIMGLAASHEAWLPLIAELLSRVRCAALAVDNRGSGRSFSPSALASYRTARMARDARECLRHAGWDAGGVHVVGHSMGGMIAAKFAALHPSLVRGLVLVSSSLGGWSALPTTPRAWSLAARVVLAGNDPEKRANVDVLCHYCKETLDMLDDVDLEEGGGGGSRRGARAAKRGVRDATPAPAQPTPQAGQGPAMKRVRTRKDVLVREYVEASLENARREHERRERLEGRGAAGRGRAGGEAAPLFGADVDGSSLDGTTPEGSTPEGTTPMSSFAHPFARDALADPSLLQPRAQSSRSRVAEAMPFGSWEAAQPRRGGASRSVELGHLDEAGNGVARDAAATEGGGAGVSAGVAGLAPANVHGAVGARPAVEEAARSFTPSTSVPSPSPSPPPPTGQRDAFPSRVPGLGSSPSSLAPGLGGSPPSLAPGLEGSPSSLAPGLGGSPPSLAPGQDASALFPSSAQNGTTVLPPAVQFGAPSPAPSAEDRAALPPPLAAAALARGSPPRRPARLRSLADGDDGGNGLLGQAWAVWKHHLSRAEVGVLRRRGGGLGRSGGAVGGGVEGPAYGSAPPPFPLLVVHGREDAIAPASRGASLAHKLRAPLLLIEGGHFLPLESRRALAAVLSDFVNSRCAVSRPSAFQLPDPVHVPRREWIARARALRWTPRRWMHGVRNSALLRGLAGAERGAEGAGEGGEGAARGAVEEGEVPRAAAGSRAELGEFR